MPSSQTKGTSQANSVFRKLFAVALLVAVICSALMSWSSSRTLAFSFGGTWKSSDGGELSVRCEGGSAWTSTCALVSENIQYEGSVRASPLTGGGWVVILETSPSNTSVLSHHGKALTVVTDLGNGHAKRIRYTRNQALTEDFMSAVRMKGKYIAALFLIVGTYKWVQVSVFGAPVRRVRRF